MAGIIVAAIVLCLCIIGAGIFYCWRRRKRNKDTPEADGTEAKVEVEDTSPSKLTELQSDAKRPGELTGDGEYYAPNKKPGGAEMEGSPAPGDRAEVQGTPGGVEMEGSRGGVEMEGSPVPQTDRRGQNEVFELPANDSLGSGPPRAASHKGRERLNSNPRWSWRRSRGED